MQAAAAKRWGKDLREDEAEAEAEADAASELQSSALNWRCPQSRQGGDGE